MEVWTWTSSETDLFRFLKFLRCVTKCTCGTPKGKSFTVSETPEVNIPEKDKSGEYNCQEDGVNYMHRKFPNHPDIKTDTWQECQKKCAATEHCKFFTWHKRSNRYKNDCALSQTYGWKKKDSTVSGPRECSKRKSKSDQISKLWGVSKKWWSIGLSGEWPTKYKIVFQKDFNNARTFYVHNRESLCSRTLCMDRKVWKLWTKPFHLTKKIINI